VDILDNIRESIYTHVWGGFYDQSEVEEMILETLREEQEFLIDDDATENDTIDEEAIKSMIQVEFARKQAAEQTWPKQTDCDRLDQVFNTLNTIGILALQNAGYTQSDGLDDIAQLYAEAGGEQSSIRGYCFYHGQDLERAVQSEGLYLTFGHVDDTDEGKVEIGRSIEQALIQADFLVTWDGSGRSRIFLPNIDWKKRYVLTQ
jgi:hypothetical protein